MNGIFAEHNKEELGEERALQLSTLCSALAKMLMRQEEVLDLHIDTLCTNGLVSALVQIVEAFLPWNGHITIRSVALSKAARIMHIVCLHNVHIQTEFADSLSTLLIADVSSDIKIEAACAAAIIASHPQIREHKHISATTKSLTTPMISTLTTAIACASKSQKVETICALLNVARSGPTARVKMSKRRDTICRFIECFREPSVALNVLKIAAMLLSCQESAKQLRSSNASTGSVLLRGLAAIANEETVSEPCRELTVAVLISVAEDDQWKSRQIDIVIDSLIEVTYSELCEEIRTEVAFALCRLATAFKTPAGISRRLYPTLINYTRFPVAYIRIVALHAVEMCTGKPNEACFFMEERSFAEDIASILTDGPNKEQSVAISILCNCSQDPQCAEQICQIKPLLHAIVDNLVNGPEMNKQTELNQLDIVLNIMTSKSNMKYLTEHTQILPWMATFTASRELEEFRRQQAVQAVVQLSHYFLLSGVPNRILV